MLVKLSDYERIFQIISAIVESEDGDPTHSCVQYSLFGATILVDHFGPDAKIRCGLATYHLGEDDQVLCFGEKKSSGVLSTNEGFHCWVEVNGWLLDFMAPKFGEIKKTDFTARPRMFQKRFSEMAEHPNDMTHAGDFFLKHNPELSESLMMPIVEHRGIQDLARLCSRWFRKAPKRIQMTAATVDQNGKMRQLTLKSVSIKSNW